MKEQMDLIIDRMASVKGKVSSTLRKRIEEVLRLCEPYKSYGEKFTFATIPELNGKVNDVLIALSDELLDEYNDDALFAISTADDDEDKPLVLAWINRDINGENAQYRVDKYSSHLKHILEGWAAIGFVSGLPVTKTVVEAMAYIDNPFVSPLWQSAFKNPKYLSPIIQSKGFSYGKGTPTSVLQGLTLVGQYMINDAFQYASVQKYKRMGAIGYMVHRGSGYDCPSCDSLCGYVHPLDEVCLPSHNRCCCYSTPVFAE